MAGRGIRMVWYVEGLGYRRGMNLLALIIGILAIAVFVIDYVQTKSLIALGLALTVATILVQWLTTSHSITF